jgi:hypothetical protein
MVLAYAVPGVLAPLPAADGAGQRYHAGVAQSASAGSASPTDPRG